MMLKCLGKSIAIVLPLGVATALAQGAPPLVTLTPIEQGFRIISTGALGNCIACHALPGQRDVPSSFGPSFDKVGTRYDATGLRQWITDARQLKPDTLMPPFGTTQGTTAANQARPILSADEISHVVAALQTLR